MTTGSPGDDSVSSPGLEEVIEELARIQSSKMATGAIAVVEAYDSTTQRCTARPVVRGFLKGRDESVRFPPISRVPVAFPGGGGYSVTWPLKAGDFVFLVFADRAIDGWLQTGQGDVVASSRRRHDLSDAVAIPAVRPFSGPRDLADGTDLVIGQDENGTPVSNPGLLSEPLQLRLGPAGIRLGDGGSLNDVLNVLYDFLVVVNGLHVGSTTALIARIDAIRRP